MDRYHLVFSFSITKMQEELNKLAQLANNKYQNEPTDDYLLIFMNLLQQNRALIDKVAGFKAQQSNKLKDMDTVYLNLQNLNYKLQHLQLEIQRLGQQETLYTEIEMHSVEEFGRLNPAAVTDNDHQLMISRLEFELSERKRLLQELENRKRDKENMKTKAKEKMDRLEHLIGLISKIAIFTHEMQLEFELTKNASLYAFCNYFSLPGHE